MTCSIEYTQFKTNVTLNLDVLHLLFSLSIFLNISFRGHLRDDCCHYYQFSIFQNNTEMLELHFYNCLWFSANQLQREQNTKKGLGKFHMLMGKLTKHQVKPLIFQKESNRFVSAGFSDNGLPHTHLFLKYFSSSKGACSRQKFLIQIQK